VVKPVETPEFNASIFKGAKKSISCNLRAKVTNNRESAIGNRELAVGSLNSR